MITVLRLLKGRALPAVRPAPHASCRLTVQMFSRLLVPQFPRSKYSSCFVEIGLGLGEFISPTRRGMSLTEGTVVARISTAEEFEGLSQTGKGTFSVRYQIGEACVKFTQIP